MRVRAYKCTCTIAHVTCAIVQVNMFTCTIIMSALTFVQFTQQHLARFGLSPFSDAFFIFRLFLSRRPFTNAAVVRVLVGVYAGVHVGVQVGVHVPSGLWYNHSSSSSSSNSWMRTWEIGEVLGKCCQGTVWHLGASHSNSWKILITLFTLNVI